MNERHKERKIWIEKKSEWWMSGDVISFRWDSIDGEFGGYIKVLGIRPDGAFSLEFLPPNSFCGIGAESQP